MADNTLSTAVPVPGEEVPEKEQDLLVIGASPHIRAAATTAGIMGWVVAALLPLSLYSIYYFGWGAVVVIGASLAGTMLTEAAVQRVRHLPVSLLDGSAVVTGLLLALTLPPRLPFWIPFIGGVVAMLLGKHAFGGLGHNIFNPALVGRAFLFVSWTWYMTNSYMITPRSAVTSGVVARINAVTGATPLVAMTQSREGLLALDSSDYIRPLLFGNPWGQLGEVSALLILVGLAILIAKRLIDWRVPAIFAGTVAIGSWMLGVSPLFALLSGGLLLGACFMATDYVTNPMTALGKIIFAFGCGITTLVLRFYSNLPEGVMFAILFMNTFTPFIDRYLRPRPYGHAKAKDKKQAEAAA
ncbi:MAG: RnfABCDGE type electron transport complex subunit D [Candidatus Geothermincolia bacterium]